MYSFDLTLRGDPLARWLIASVETKEQTHSLRNIFQFVSTTEHQAALVGWHFWRCSYIYL